LRPSQLVEEEKNTTVQQKKKKKKKEEEQELFFCLLRLINSTELIRCQCCSDFGRFVRLISGEKTQRNSKKAKEINGNR
jgi:ERCC4-related helicase